MTNEQLKENVQRYGSISAAARALRVPRQTLSSALQEGRGIGGRWPEKQRADLSQPKREVAPSAPGRTFAEFRERYDKSYIVPRRIREGLAQLGESWEYEADFARRCGVSLQDLGIFRSQFEQFVVVVRADGKRVWAGTVSFAERLRAKLTARPL